jgi:hypothetical protein
VSARFQEHQAVARNQMSWIDDRQENRPTGIG